MKPKMSFQDWCLQNRAYLLLHFYQEGNNPLSPDKIGFSSGKRVWFRCHVCGLSWQRTLNHVTRNPAVQTCPFCEHRKPSPFYNLATEYPELKDEWDSERNPFPPESCLPHSKQNVYWRCTKNHRWRAIICDRAETAEKARKSGAPVCPYCSGERVSTAYNLAEKYPEVAAEWGYVLNNGQKPEDFPPHSNHKAWWKCTYNPSHKWLAKISNRTSLGRGCPNVQRTLKCPIPRAHYSIICGRLAQAVPVRNHSENIKWIFFCLNANWCWNMMGIITTAVWRPERGRNRKTAPCGRRGIRCFASVTAGSWLSRLYFKNRKFYTDLTSGTGILTK